MTTAKMIESVNKIYQLCNDEEKKILEGIHKKGEKITSDNAGILFDGVTHHCLALLEQLRRDLFAEEARKKGKSRQLQAAKRILKSGEKQAHKSCHYAPILDGKQYFCDGYRLVILNQPLSGFPDLPDVVEPMDYDSIINPFTTKQHNDYLDLPDPAKLRAYIKTEKAVKGRSAIILFDFGEGFPVVNADFLLDMLEALPNCQAVCFGELTPIYFKAGDGCGLLLPIHTTKDTKRGKTKL